METIHIAIVIATKSERYARETGTNMSYALFHLFANNEHEARGKILKQAETVYPNTQYINIHVGDAIPLKHITDQYIQG